jgi:hypothetical protein
MKKIVLLILLVMATFSLNIPVASAQCAMCTINAEQGAKNGNTQTKGINTGVLYLMATPFILIGGIGLLWYRKYKNHPAPLHS